MDNIMFGEMKVRVPLMKANELETAEVVEGYYYLENGYWMTEGVPDLEYPVERHYIVDKSGKHREIAESTLTF